MEEKDLYSPVKTLFESMDYKVQGEVRTVDVVAQKDDHLVAIELKKDLNLHLIAQGAYRQRLTDYVYVVVPTPTGRIQRGRAYKDKVYILRRLGVGLIHVNLDRKKPTAKIILEPNLLDIKASQQRNKKKKLLLQQEMNQRKTNKNVGGTRGKTMTAYREATLQILRCFEDEGPIKSNDIRKRTGNPKATRIMYQNHYGWFQRIENGLYGLTDKGRDAINKYSSVIEELPDLMELPKKEA